MEVKKPIFCALAFGSVSINAYGEYIPCCSIRTDSWKMYKDADYDYGIFNADPHLRINAPNLKEVRKSLLNGDWPNACANCKESEAAGIGSMRTIWNSGLEPYNIPMSVNIDSKNVRYLDLTFGTKCNSKCMTCNPDLSDFWQEEHNTIWNLKPEQQRSIKRISIDDSTAEKLVRDFPNVERISFIGGEPTISEEHIKFLKLLIENDSSKKIRISYVTNLSGISDELINLWKNFKAVHISVSIDGYQKVNEYIRYPFKWNKIETNLRTYLEMVQKCKIKNDVDETQFSLGLSCTVSIFNSIQCLDLLEFWFDILQTYKTNDGSTLLNHVGCFINRVSQPVYALVALLSKEYRRIGIEKSIKLLEKCKTYIREVKTDDVNIGFIDSLKLIKNWLDEPQIINEVYLAQNKKLITESDKFRNRNLKDFIPELYTELEKLWNEQLKQEPNNVNELKNGEGYYTNNVVPLNLISNLVSKLHTCYPVRASNTNKVYAEKENIKNLTDICVWWSQDVSGWTEVQNIENIVAEYVRRFLQTAMFYSSDIVFIEPNTNYISPHVDTPHRFRKWNYDRNLLGIQVIVPLQDVDANSASTGLVPHSHKRDFDINLCYRGHYDQYFLKNVIQPTLSVGSILIYNCRLLHSCMPNLQSKPRPALLLNYLEKSIIEEVTKVDNIWTSNGK